MIIADAIARAQAGLAGAATHLAGAPREAALAWSRAQEALNSGAGVRAFAYVLVVFLTAGAVEWLYWIYAAPGYRWLVAAEPATRLGIWSVALRRIATGIVALLLSTVTLLATSAFFAWPGDVQEIIVAAALVIAAARLVAVVAAALLSPDSPKLRLVRATTREARRLVPALALSAVLLAGGLVAPELLRPASPDLAAAIGILTFLLASALIVWTASRAEQRRVRRAGRRRIPPLPHWAFAWCVLVALMWLAGAPRWTMTIIVASLALVGEAVSRRTVRAFWRAKLSESAHGESDGPASLYGELAFDLSLRCVRFLVALVAIGGCILVWDIPVLSDAGSQTVSARFVSQTISALALVLLADLAWAAARGWIDALLSRIAADRHGDPETGSQARLLTLLPMARKAIGVSLLVLLAVSLLSVFGIAITPLLAGAGVVGIAVGFGAQTLVRDVLSGVFYLAEDVFRLGDYIEAGQAKGTVERITLRTVALRHQNGPLHFVPYGALGSVRNNSRDWVIDKFEIPLPTDVDSEFVRKMIKRIGQEMLDDPALAALIVEPLKAKVYRIEPGVKVFRCKVQTPPGKQFEVRQAAFRRIEAALRENGIHFADTRSQILLQAQGAGAAAASPPSGAGGPAARETAPVAP